MPDLHRLREIYEGLGPSSVIDILLLAAAVFGLLRVLSGTRAMVQVRGAIIVGSLAILLGRIFDLTAVNYLIDHSAGIAVIAAVVIFQPELRRALDRMGRASLSYRTAESGLESMIRAVGMATDSMSRQRHGGLIVLERETGLQDIIENGVPVGAKASPELLESIFFPKSPLHDMAVVVRGDEVVAAGCVLPLSEQRTSSGETLGTRHRAALGVTENTDAIAVVVSEETGSISISLAGKLTAVADSGRLQTVLNWLLAPSQVEQAVAALGRGR